ncbi:MAG: hypothetical protein MRY32_05975, partial [Rickettsiales bacterium]|nr:hypothetical protein [Rickettsiales bacterium]
MTKRPQLKHVMILLAGLFLSVAAVAGPDDVIRYNPESELTAERTRIQQQIQTITGSPAREGENLNDEIARKREETRELRERLEQIEAELAEIEAAKEAREQAEAEAAGAQAANEAAEAETAEFRTVPEGILGRDGFRVIDRPDDINNPHEDGETTTWIRNRNYTTRYTQNPDDWIFWGGVYDVTKSTKWRDVTTDCEPCKELVTHLNETMQEYFYQLGSVARWRHQKNNFRERALRGTQQGSVDVTGDNNSRTQVLAQIMEINEAYDARIEMESQQAQRLREQADELARQVVVCERQCTDEDADTSGLTRSFQSWVPTERTLETSA